MACNLPFASGSKAGLSPRDVADRLGLKKTDTVLAWIASGQLRAANIAANTSGRPLWCIVEADAAEFLAGRFNAPAAPAPPRRRRRAGGATKYF